MGITNVSVLPGCISCRNCESVCPAIFKVDPTSRVINRDYLPHAKEIFKAERLCPVNVIKVETTGNREPESEMAKGEAATLEKKAFLTRDVVELRFRTKGFSFLPGQYVSLSFRDAQGSFRRSYSIVSGDGSGFVLAVKLLSSGRGSKALQKLKVGDFVEYFGGMGHFVLRDSPTHKVFVATGTGLAPMMAMLAATPDSVPQAVIFGARTEGDLFYLERLRKIKNAKVIVTLSQPGAKWKGAAGRVTDHLGIVTPQSEVYVCGNPDMVESVKKALHDAGHDSGLVFAEEFVAQGSTASDAEKSRGTLSFLKRIVLDGEIPGLVIATVQWTFIAFAFAVPFLWGFFPKLRTELWSVSWISVVTLMAVRPLADIFPKISLFRALIPLRQWLGILSASVVVTNLGFTAWNSWDSLVSSYLSARGWRVSSRALFARVSEITAVLLLVTSNAWSQRTLRANWKRLQRLSYAYFFSAGIILHWYGQTSALYAMVAIAALWIAAEITKKVRARGASSK